MLHALDAKSRMDKAIELEKQQKEIDERIAIQFANQCSSLIIRKIELSIEHSSLKGHYCYTYRTELLENNDYNRAFLRQLKTHLDSHYINMGYRVNSYIDNVSMIVGNLQYVLSIDWTNPVS
jgi:hypothetical protein